MNHPESLVFLQDDVVMGGICVSQQLYDSRSQSVSEEKDEKIEETHSGAGIEQSGRFTGNKPITPSSD